MPYHNVVAGIIYVPRTGVPWRYVSARELGCGSGVTCWRRLVEWQQAGVWEQLHTRLLERANATGGWTGRRPAWTAPACGPSDARIEVKWMG